MNRRILLIAIGAAMAAPLHPQAAAPAIASAPLSLDQKEEFLRSAKVIRSRAAKKGITGTVRVTLSDGTTTHDASVQRIDEEKARFEGAQGVEMNFRDTYKFNIAAYKLGRLLGIGQLIPPSVERRFEGSTAAWTWWVDDVIIDEGERLKQKRTAPDKDDWGRQYHIMRVYDQLIANTDRNVQNILYDKDWHLWMIDHSRAFRIAPGLRDQKLLERCDNQLMTALKELREDKLKAELGEWLREREIKGILSRRDKIVAHFNSSPHKMYEYLSPR